MRRAAAGLGAVTGLLLGLVGVPIALLLIGTSTWPDSWSVAAVLGALTRPDDGQLLAVLLIVVGWVAWAVFAVSVVAEAIQLLPRSRVRIRIPGLGAPQRLAAMLLVAAIALVPTASPARATPPSPAPAPTMPVSQAAPIDVTRPTDQPPTEPPAAPAAQSGPSKRSTPATRERDGVVHRVVAGDDLWSLAETYYGDGLQWRTIAKANGHVLTGGPDRLQTGWLLAIPGVKSSHPSAEHSDNARQVIVHGGDTLSAIAHRELGSASRWAELYEANRSVLDDPDELTIGTSLVIPSTGAERAATSDAARQRTDEHTGSERPPRSERPAQPEHRTQAGQQAQAGHQAQTQHRAESGTSDDDPAENSSGSTDSDGTDSDGTVSDSTDSHSTDSDSTVSDSTDSHSTGSVAGAGPAEQASARPASPGRAQAPAAPGTQAPATARPDVPAAGADSVPPLPLLAFAGVGGLLAAGRDRRPGAAPPDPAPGASDRPADPASGSGDGDRRGRAGRRAASTGCGDHRHRAAGRGRALPGDRRRRSRR